MQSSADVVVIGAGIQGLSAAYHLARVGLTNVAVVEENSIGSGSSGRSASMLMLQRENIHKITLSLYSYRRYMNFKEEFGVDTGFKKIGFLSVVPRSKLGIAKEMASLRQQMGVVTDLLSPDEIASFVPMVNVADIELGVFGPDDGVIDAHALLLGFKDGLKRLGGAIYQGTKATGIRTSRQQITAVETTDGEISTPWVVNAAGARASEVGAWVGVEIPISNRTRSIYITAPFPAIPSNVPMVEDAEAEWYFRKEGEGVLMGMGKEESRPQSDQPNWDFLPAVADFAAHRVPILAQAEIAHGWSGIRPITPDINPIIGPVDELSGFINSCGWGGEGIMHAPAGGQIVAESITGLRTSGLDAAPYLLSRFTTPHGKTNHSHPGECK